MEWDKDRQAFLDVVGSDGYAPEDVGAIAEVLDDLIRWSAQQRHALRFLPHDGVQSVVKFALADNGTPLRSAYPRKKDGAKLSVVDFEGPPFTERARDLARRELAQLDGRNPDSNEQPRVSFQALRDPGVRTRVKCLLSRLLDELGYRDEPS